ncbi:MAG: hypothetical protein KAU20_01395 [Nanoarchaeota archaeon]|nr:hypothetical protein [Nanoarchaeota archaeon]
MEVNYASKKSQKRLIAYKVRVKDILNGKYVKEEGWNPNYIVLESGRQISRINIIGTVIEKPFSENLNYQSVVLDDGSGKISVRSFEEDNKIDGLNIGDTVLIIGKLREFGSEKYIIPEIIKKIDNPKWVELRKSELVGGDVKEKSSPVSENFKEEKIEAEETKTTAIDDIFDVIKSLDKGDGADFGEIIEKSGIKDTEKIVTNLLKQGELFEIKPGKIKILE